MTIKPFYIKTDGLSEKDIADAVTLCVNHGASAVEGVDGYHSLVDFEVVDSGENWILFGVTDDCETRFWDNSFRFGDKAIEITMDQLPAHLGIDQTETPEEKEAFDAMDEKSMIDSWNAGEELPPVGATVIFCNVDFKTEIDLNLSCEVIAHSENKGFPVAVIRQYQGGQMKIDFAGHECFSKPETPQQKEEREQREQEFGNIVESDNSIAFMNVEMQKKAMRHMFDLMIDSGYRKADHGKK